MNARHELAREAELILLQAGCVAASAKHYGPFWAVAGMRADEREVSGHTRDQADPQDPRDLARRLAAQFAVKPELEDIPEAPETVEETFPLGEGPFDPALAEPPEASETPQDETHGETGEEAALIDLPASGLGGGSGEENAEGVSVSDADESRDEDQDRGGLVTGGVDCDMADESIHDADFTVTDLDTIELIEPDPNPDFGSELLEFEGELAAGPAQADAAGAFIFGDNIHQLRTVAIGLVTQHAMSLKPPPTDYLHLAQLRNFVLGDWADDAVKRKELDELEALERRRHDIAEACEKKVLFLNNDATREQIEAFDPAADWP